MGLGLDPDVFWRKTPREVSLIVEGRSRFLEREHNDRAWLAWHIAALSRIKRMPKLDRMMLRPTKEKPQTWEQQLQIVMQLNAAFGGKVVKRPKK